MLCKGKAASKIGGTGGAACKAAAGIIPKGFIRSTFEPDELGAPIPGLHVQVTAKEAAGYAATASALQLDRLWLLYAEDNVARTVRVQLPSHLSTFVVLPGNQPAVLAGGVPFHRTQLNQHCPGRDYHQTTEGPSLTSTIMLAPGSLRDFAGAMGFPTPATDLSQLINPSFHALQRLMRLHVSAMRLVRESPERIARAEAMRGLENAMLGGLMDCLAGSEGEATSVAAANHQDIIRKLDDVLAAHPNSNLNLTDLAVMVGVPSRTLRACCQEQLGMGPKHFLMLRRLHLVRRKLVDSTPDSVSVTDAATEFGFWELGRFSGAFRETFGEAPSATLRREPGAPQPAMSRPYAASQFAMAGKYWAGTQWAAALKWITDIERSVGITAFT